MKYLIFFNRVVVDSLLVVITLILLVQVLSRYLFGIPLVWTEELARYLFVWVAFLGIGYGVSERSHIQINFFTKNLSPKKLLGIRLFIEFLTLGAVIYLAPYCWELFDDQRYVMSSVLQIPMSWIVLALPVGLISYIIFSSHQSILDIKRIRG
ncbi:TRAP transporter small permease [Photobacterium satsumensis]|uniref:TRAP transporter small permease n=1 Tax=Photobacterium satsumensis TaxID=2910239 RepID=UPI003D12C8AC